MNVPILPIDAKTNIIVFEELREYLTQTVQIHYNINTEFRVNLTEKKIVTFFY